LGGKRKIGSAVSNLNRHKNTIYPYGLEVYYPFLSAVNSSHYNVISVCGTYDFGEPMSEKTLNVAGCKCKTIVYQAPGAPVVFLHGYSYASSIWQRISIITLLTEKHVPFLAMDMPYGQKSECQPKSHDDQTNVTVAREAVQSVFGSEVPVLAGASLGGHVALMYAAQFPVKGLLLVGPSRVLAEGLLQKYSQFKFPVRIIWGSQDNIISGEDMRVLAEKLPKAKLVTYEGAGHSAYINQPERFKRDLLELYALAEQG
jgi:pimeloyl-ACP methyl ester carboxylesterase